MKAAPLTDSLDDTAAAWQARRDAGLSLADERELARWLAADPKHAAVWAEFEASAAILERARADGAAGFMVNELDARRRRRQFRVMAGLATGLAACAAAFFVVMRPAASVPIVPDGRGAVVSRPSQRTLPDGSVVELNRNAEITVDYQTDVRRIHLLLGEAHFAVAKNPARPFIVSAGPIEVRAVGTAFNVRLDPADVDVVVTEGRVAVAETAAAVSATGTPLPEPIYVSAGAGVTMPLVAVAEVPPVVPLPPVEMNERMAWRGPKLELSGTRLGEAVELLNKENALQLSIDDPALAEMRMSGVFRADNAEGFVRLLEANYGVHAQRVGDTMVLRKIGQ